MIKEQKKQLRKEVLARREALTEQERKENANIL